MSSTSVGSSQRFTHGRRCPICGGADNDPRGREKRCHGYVSPDGEWVHCTREESAGGLERHEKSEAFVHKMRGPCKCGVTHLQAERSSNIEAEYNYYEENGDLAFQVVRFFGKDFRQRKPDGKGGWIWKLENTRRVLYRLPELLAAADDAIVFIVEGEKDVDTLRSRGLIATTNPQGAGKWHHVEDCAHGALRGRHVAIIPDADERGRKHANDIAASLLSVARSVRKFEVPNAKDVTEWFANGGTVEQLLEMANTDPAGDDGVFADRDAEPSTPAAPKLTGRTWADCVEEIYARKDEPWIDIRIGQVVIATCRNGSFVPLIAPSGAGKSTLAIQMLIDHAMMRGPAVYLTYELDGDEAVARAIGQQCSFSWAGVLRGEVPRAIVPLVSRLRILERDEATLANLEKAVEELRKEFPEQPVFVVADYLQATPAPPGKERGFVANVSSDLRRTAKKLRIVLIGVSQASTANSKAMRSGDLLGIDASATGAETAQIERDAYVILALGDRQQVDPDTVSWKLSVAKYRLGTADVVHELHYRGRIGIWEAVGEARSATEVRDSRDSEAKQKKIDELKRAITTFVSASIKPVSQKDIIAVSTGKERTVVSAIRELIQDGVLAHVHGSRKGGHALIWTTEKLAQGGATC